MRWVLLFFGSLATGVLAIVLSLALLLVSLSIYDRYILGIASNGAVGWDPVSIFGRYWVIGIPLLIFGLVAAPASRFLASDCIARPAVSSLWLALNPHITHHPGIGSSLGGWSATRKLPPRKRPGRSTSS